MSQDDQPSDRAAAPRISRDTLLLLGALTFLILAVALTFLFTPNTENTAQATTTAIAGAAPSTAPAPGGEGPGYPAPSAAADAPAAVPSPAASGGSPYPAPTSGQATSAYPNPAGGAAASPTAGGGASEPSTTAAAGAEASPTIGVDAAGTAYPAPEGTVPAQPTFNPIIQTSTIAPPPPPGGTVNSSQQQPGSATSTAVPTTPPPPPSPTPPPPPTPTDVIVVDPTAAPPADSPKEPPPTVPPLPTAPPAPAADVLRGNVRWATGQSPIILRRDVLITPGSELIIEPGVEVRLDPGVSIYVDGGRLLALGLPGRQVRFVGSTGARWSGIYGRPNSFVVLEHTLVRGGGVGGTVMAFERSELVIRSSTVTDNGGAILLTDTKLEVRDTEIAGNDMPYGAALDAAYTRGSFVTLLNNRIGGNILAPGAPGVRITSQSTFDILNLEITGNLLRGGDPNLQLVTNGELQGTIACNAMIGEALGFGLRTQTLQVDPNGRPPMALRIENNIIDEHIPPIIPVYLKYGLGRGATSEILLDMRNNWWGEASGPYEPDANPLGRGDSVGSNILFQPWLTAAPACAPRR